MATFFTDLFQSIFTPGPTPSLLIATNVAFAALQSVLLALLIATYSVHFVILSFLSAGLWWAINWFAAEIKANQEKEKAEAQGEEKKDQGSPSVDDSGTETEDAVEAVKKGGQFGSSEGGLRPMPMDDLLRKRRSLGEVSGTDSEWDKVENEGDDN
ncbi:SMK killer toxin resistance protein [Xylographa opegraphella]|nr:SMK killer toxin resistance protein [Xylographa opegraphella]